MNIIPYEAKHLLGLRLQENQAYCTPPLDAEYAKALEGPYAFTALEGERVLIVAGVLPILEHRALAWALVDQEAGPHFTEITRAAKRLLEAVPYRRIEADTPVGFHSGHRWLKMLGFRMEAPRMVGYRVDGGDSSLYARTR